MMQSVLKHPLLKNTIRPLMAILLLTVLIKTGPFKLDQIQFILSQTRILVLGFFIFGFQFLLLALRWKLIVNVITKLQLKLSLIFTLIGHFFSFFIPGGVGADVVKALELSKNNSISKSDALSTVFADRILGLYLMVFSSSLFLGLDYIQEKSEPILKYLSFSLMLWFIMTTGLLFGPLITLFVNQTLAHKTNRILLTLKKLISSFNLTFVCFRKPKVAIGVLLLSLAAQGISSYFMIEVVRALNITPPSFFIFFSLTCFAFLASAIPITPAGIGVGQAAVYFLFSTLSPQLGNAAVTAISVLQLFYLFYAVIGGVLFSSRPLLKKLVRAELPDRSRTNSMINTKSETGDL